MGDPVSAGVVGSVLPKIGAVAANPFVDALTVGGTSLMGSSTSPFSIGSVLNGIGTNYVAGGDPIKGALMNAAVYTGSGASGFPINPEIGSNAILGSESLGGLWKDVQGANQWMNENPFAAQMGLKAGSALLQPHQIRPMGGGGQVSRGQIPQMDFMSLLNPQQQTVIRPQAMSLL